MIDLAAILPAPFKAPTHTQEEILAMAGISADQYRIREDVGYWYSPGVSPRSDTVDGRQTDGTSSSAAYAQRAKDGIWEFGAGGISRLLEGDYLGDQYHLAFARAVLDEMGAGEKIAGIQAWLVAELDQAQADYCARVQEFTQALQAHPAFDCLPSGMRERVKNLADPQQIAGEIQVEWAKAMALHHRRERGELVNFGGDFRMAGRTGNNQFWVICQDGSERAPDEVWGNSQSGMRRWNVVGPDELAIAWSKAFTAAEHEFRVIKTPAGGCTPAQLDTVERIEREIDARWAGVTGMSGKKSPDVGTGWGLRQQAEPAAPAAKPDKPISGQEQGGEVSIAALRQRWGAR